MNSLSSNPIILTEESVGKINLSEGKFSSALAKASFIAALLACPDLLIASKIEKNLNAGQSVQQAIDNAAENVDVDNANTPGKNKSQYSPADIANIIARTIFGEAEGESKTGKEYVATVIYNRAGGDVSKFVDVCFARSQFSMWNAINPSKDPAYSPKEYKMVVPKRAIESKVSLKAWEDCKELASELVTKKFKPKGNYNAYFNPKKASPDWESKLMDKIKVGNHVIGYLLDQDPKRKGSNRVAPSGSTTYVVKSTDKSISQIALDLINAGKTNYTKSEHKTFINAILAKNSFKKNANGHPIINPGQTIIIPTK